MLGLDCGDCFGGWLCGHYVARQSDQLRRTTLNSIQAALARVFIESDRPVSEVIEAERFVCKVCGESYLNINDGIFHVFNRHENKIEELSQAAVVISGSSQAPR